MLFYNFAGFLARIVGIEGDDGEDGAEDFFFHTGMGGIIDFYDRGFEAKFFGVALAASDNFFVVAQEGFEAFVVTFINDGAHGFGFGELPAECADEGRREGIIQILRDEDIIWGDAGLTGICEFAEDDAIGDGIDIFGLNVEDDARGFSAEFENVGGEIFSACFGDGFSGVCTAGEEDEIEVIAEDFLCRFGIAFDDDDGVRIEVAEDELGDECARFGSVFAGFDDGDVSSGDGCDEGGDGELDRVVPGADDEGDAAWLSARGAEVGEEEERRPVGF